MRPHSFPAARAASAPVLALAAMLLGGCASVPLDSMESDVQRHAAAQVGPAPAWRRAASADAAAAARVASLLQDGLTADEAVEVALLRNPDVQLAFEELGVARSRYLEAALAPNPVIDASYRTLRDGPGQQVELGLVQNVLALLTLPARRRAARAELDGATLGAAESVVRLAAEARSDYWRLVAAERATALWTQHEDVARLLFELAERYHAAGNISLIERERERDLWLDAKSRLLEARAEAGRQRATLERRLGLAAEARDWRVADALPPLPAEDPAVDRLEQDVPARRLDIQAAKRAIDARAAALGLTRRLRLLPVLEAGVSTEREPDGERLTGPSLSLELPLFDARQAAVAAADGEARAAMRRAEALALEARREVRSAWAGLRAARELVETIRDGVLPAREAIVSGEQAEYFYMLKGPFDPLRARQEELKAREAQNAALSQYWLERIELARAAGDLSIAREPVPAGKEE